MKPRIISEEIRDHLQSILLQFPESEESIRAIYDLVDKLEKQKPLDFVINSVDNISDLNFADRNDEQQESFDKAQAVHDNKE